MPGEGTSMSAHLLDFPGIARFLPAMGPLVLLVATLVLHGSRRWASAVFGAALVFNLATATLALLRVLIEGSERVVLWAPSGYGFDLQLDALSTTLVLLVAFVGALVGRFAAVSLAGERERGRFAGYQLALPCASEKLSSSSADITPITVMRPLTLLSKSR